MKTLKEAKEYAASIRARSTKFTKLVLWIEKENSQFVVYNSLSGVVTNQLKKKQIFV